MRNDEHETPTYGSLTPEDAFALVGNDVRAGVLWALSDARGGEGDPPALPFSELRTRVDADIDSSQFNYHLQRLVGHFVERRDGGYALRPEGTTLTRTIRAGTFTRQASLSAFELGLDCYFCGTPVEATYDDWLFRAQCSGCDYLYDLSLVPPGVLDDGEPVPAQVSRYNRHRRLSFARGACHTCGNDLDVQFIPASDTGWPRIDQREGFVHLSCDHCGDLRYLTVGETLLKDPALISFCHERGLDVTTTPLWQLEFAMTDRDVTVRSTDPLEAALRITLDGDALELVVDGDLTVAERGGP